MKADLPVSVQRAPSTPQLRTFGALAFVYLALTVGLLRWAGEPGPGDPHIVVVYGIAIMLADLFTASLLGALYRGSGRAALLLLACAYFYGGLMAGLHMATFPGALFPEPLFGQAQTVGWLYLAWRLGMAALFLAAISQAGREPSALPAARRDRALFAGCALVLAAAALAASLAARSTWLEIDGDRFSELGRGVQWAAVSLCALGLALIWRRRAFNDVLYLWLGLVLVASISDLTLSNVAGARFTMGWHAARASLVVSSCLLLAFLLGDLADDERARAKAPWLPAAYGGAAAVTLGAVLLRWFLDPWLGEAVPYITLYGAVSIAVWFGGVGPAVLATVLGYAIANVRYIAPEGALEIAAPADAIALGLFSLSCSLIIVLGEAMRRARDRYRASEVELKEHARQLQRADSNKSRFLAVMAHELRNPLAPLRTGVALLRLKHQDPAARETHDMMERQIAQLTRLIDDLLDVSRIDRGKLELRSERVPIESVMRTALDTARPNLDAKGHTLTVRAPPAPLFVQGDAVRLSQVLSNLLNNAAKFTPANGRIELSAGEEAGRVVVTVADNGVGIAPEDLKEVFDMFVQLENPNPASAGGLGLGLTLARSIVERHGGSIEARSAGRGQGAQFIVRLPVAPPPPPRKANQETPRAQPARRRVLVVDDNVDAAQTLAQYLRLDGHRVESALDGEGALRIAEVLHPDIAFIDLNMPGMDGLEVAKRLRVTSWGRGARLVALTGMGQQADVARTREAGFDEHLTKPADLHRVSRIAAGMNGEAR
ncbi:MAG TPA: ATP-binding protein [Burkholderiales bacterium]|nr:ATP-binding protein [Burkholderiales bacterium]